VEGTVVLFFDGLFLFKIKQEIQSKFLKFYTFWIINHFNNLFIIIKNNIRKY